MRSGPRGRSGPGRAVAAALLLGLAAVEPPRAQAEAPDPPTNGPPRDPELLEIASLTLEQLLDRSITTASKSLERATEAPATVYVITREDIRRRGYSTLVDVLRDLPGMEVVEQYYSEQGTLVPVRGVVGNNKIVLLVNGTRVNPPGGEELMIRSDISVRFAEQIEVIYGPGSTLYGADAISAVINIKTREGSGSELLAGYGSTRHVEGFGGFGVSLSRDKRLRASGFASFVRSDLSDFSEAHPAWWARYQSMLPTFGRSAEPVRGDLGVNAFARLESQSASLQAWYRQSERSSAEGSGEGGAEPVLYFVDEAKWRDSSLVIEGQHALRFSDSVVLHSTLAFNRYEIHPSSRYVFPVGPGLLFLDDYKYGVGTSASVEEKLDLALPTGARLIVGFIAADYDIIPKATVPGGANPDADVVSQAGTLRTYTVPGDPSSLLEINRAVNLQYQQYGFYAEASQPLAFGLRAIAGLRVDLNSRYDDVPLSPRAALIARTLSDRLTLKYVFSRAYVAPAPYFSYNIFDNGRQISRGNPDLAPERAMSNEVNAVWTSPGLLVSLSAFVNHQSNLLITSQSEAPGTVVNVPGTDMPQLVYTNLEGTGPARVLTRSINLGSSRAIGFDAFFQLQLGPLSARGSYSYVDVERTVGATRSGLDQISRHNVRAGWSWELVPDLVVSASLVLRSTPENLSSNYQGMGVSLATPYEVDAGVLYAPLRFLDVFVTLRNLTDHRFALRGVSGPAPQEPFAIFAGTRLSH